MSSVTNIAKIEASLDKGGWEMNGVVLDDADRLDFYQLIEVSFDFLSNGLWEPNSRIGFSGHLLPEEWTKNVQGSIAPWKAFTAQEIMKMGRIQGIFFKNVSSSPANDHQIVGMTYADIVEEVLGIQNQYGHCNLAKGVWPEGICSLNIDKSNSSSISEYTVKEGNFYSALAQIAQIDGYELWCSKDNTINFVPHPMFGTLPDPVFELTNDWLLEPLGIERHEELIGQVKMRGSTPAGIQISGKYPTSQQIGPIKYIDDYLASSSAKMDEIAERKYRLENRDFTVKARVPGAVGLMVEILDRITITYSSSVDGISWSDKPFWIHQISVDINDNFSASTEFVLESEN